ncbi:MAG TPA: hypothetical protein PKL69_08600 [Agitococcus sp.]|uniref:hypothetical protein n=1 Tax=uncultured Agitococcus sp. TaxID=1506599 RepID=UPI00262A7E6B|nr:hypothetical protein [uncultured Agitococcus sp.]HMU88359.1 hypothetical protein [Agitococcus sp.]HMV60114.1 hypothetical protein [Agitococcus sp.]HMX99023.1 hypothetical protein [Agitococcus sp.]HMY27504.1 hypothetical protein [Agitococcus sp.]HMY82313.1 hypothetical protein [Agitococcus sp.]
MNTSENISAEQSPQTTKTLTALLAESLQSKKEATNYPQPNKDRFSQRPSRPPHGTRRSMGKR